MWLPQSSVHGSRVARFLLRNKNKRLALEASSRIDRLDATREVPEGPMHAELAADYLDRITSLWADGYLAQLQHLPENAFPPIRPSGGEAARRAGCPDNRASSPAIGSIRMKR